MIRAAVLALVLALVAPALARADGEVIQVAGQPEVYRVVGGAPLWINSCDYAPGCGNLQQVPNLDAYRQFPADGALARQWDTGAVYRFAGGAPLWISSCGYGPGCPVIIEADGNALTHPSHVRAMPADGTVVENVSDGAKYRFAGGAPLLVRCDLGAGCSNSVQVDGGTFQALGGYQRAPTMRQYPADGTTIQNVEDGTHYRFAGGAPLPLAGCVGCGAVQVDNLTFRLNGTATPSQPHLLGAPVEGTFLTAGNAFYRVAGGAAVQLFDCAVLSKCEGAITVDATTIASRGGGRLLATPRDGTVLRGLPSNRTWEIVGGFKRQTFISGLGGIEVDDTAVARIPTEEPPPTPPAPTVFKPVISSGYKVYRRYTRFTSLKVKDAPAGSVITVNCSGKRKGCPFSKQKYYKLKGTSLNVYSRWFKKAKLKSGATVTVRVSSPAGARKQMVFKIRSRKLPVRTTRCSNPGGKLGRCAT